MDETTKYMELMCNVRALLVSDEDAISGGVTLSAETVKEIAEEDLPGFIELNFATFLRCIRFLPDEEQTLLISYYLLKKSQTSLAKIHGNTQTVISFRIRAALKRVAAHIMYAATPMADVLAMAGIEDKLLDQKLSAVHDLYKQHRNFTLVARALKTSGHIKATYSAIRDRLLADPDSRKVAVGAIMDVRKPKVKSREIRITMGVDTDRFRIRLETANWNEVFYPRANVQSGVA